MKLRRILVTVILALALVFASVIWIAPRGTVFLRSEKGSRYCKYRPGRIERQVHFPGSRNEAVVFRL